MTTSTTEILHFADGRSLVVPSSWPEGRGDAVVGLDADGCPIARDDDREITFDDGHTTTLRGSGMLYGLTFCCGASFKGMEWGVGCRACYGEALGNDMPYGEVSERAGRTVLAEGDLIEVTLSFAGIPETSFTGRFVRAEEESGRVLMTVDRAGTDFRFDGHRLPIRRICGGSLADALQAEARAL